MGDEKSMASGEINAFLSERRQAIFATNRSGRPPQLSPVWYVWDDGALFVSTSAHSLKARSIAADPNVSVCVDGGWGDYRYVAMSGEVEVEPYKSELQQEMRWRIIRKYHDNDESAQAYFDSSADEEAILIVLRPSHLVFRDFNS
jgi:PPOX class probable F420-dependent enzyme